MKRKIVNGLSSFIILIGLFFLIPLETNANLSRCDWELQCNLGNGEYVCCTVCQDNGAIGSCRVVQTGSV